MTSRGAAAGNAATWKHEDVGGGIDLGQSFPVPRPHKYGIRKLSRERVARRPVANDELRARQIELQKRFKIFLDRESTNSQKDRPR